MRHTNQTRSRPARPEKKRAPSTLIFAVLLLAGAGFVVYKYQEASEVTEPQTTPVETTTTPTAQTTKPPAESRKREPRTLTPTATARETEPEVSAPTVASTTPEPRVSSSYQCDGRTRCSQMSSCAEATFFLRNCPGTQMDGDNDGIPCEQQWCSNRF
ncbi:MAG TPA: excalibur calcium-binding domain-containing protein [Pyrinomonadaceae bacterium]|nr:excalibur calcium-binding domain-containing protein [Pyrinomonadaceae bacterium]